MSPLQFYVLAAIALIGLATLATAALIAAAYAKFRHMQREEHSLLKRLENNAILKAASPPRKKYLMFWSKP